jgi:hypothetical protein
MVMMPNNFFSAEHLMRVRQKFASRAVIVVVVAAMGALATAQTNTPSTQVTRSERMQELAAELGEKHGYQLEKGEPLKYLPSADNETRDLLRYTSENYENWSTPPKEHDFSPFTLILQSDATGQLKYERSHKGATTLADVIQNAFWLMSYEYECPDGLQNAYIPGDWIFGWDLRDPHKLTHAELATFEKILNDQLKLGVKVGWKTVERPALVISGNYKARPRGGNIEDQRAAALSDGMFLIEARRALSLHPAMMEGTFDDFTDSLGYLLKLPVVNEADTRPAKKLVSWNETGKPVEGEERLTQEHENRLLTSLQEQMGYDFKIEPRKVKVLSIEAEED